MITRYLTLEKADWSTFALQFCSCSILHRYLLPVYLSLFISVICHLASFVSYPPSFVLLSHFESVLFVLFCLIIVRLFVVRLFSFIFCFVTGNVFQVFRSPEQQPSGKSINIIPQDCPIFCLSIGSKTLLQSSTLVGYLEPFSPIGLEEGRTFKNHLKGHNLQKS
jgi:hypothetical protein